ncbi:MULTISPECIES: GNAT family N-acetyltransferase [Providencia]|uniref:GNAT family N-acetyltransferase n=1 Tax=Providencia TaxID=586 RepID=UPI001981457D|nr:MULTISPECIES: GNAT family N-acetyltransferase [Providencia]MBN4864994.1 GNAT family N-acetyltransferase [Providencia stuartii]MBN4874781.1 GNAT family N-acetyltransferase [Providencia stuartii]MBN4879006.1 GNAT family N-acetyltransferase [Providencia stuartii]MBN4883981.1 GNAT family N-acetyltransferase [Providencia stuartii]
MHFVIVTKQNIQLIEQISDALHQEWASLSPWADTAQIKHRLHERSQAANPQILSCFVDSNVQLLATASTILRELPDIQQATWWLGEVLTVPSARGKRIGTQLIETLYQHYRKSTSESLYLYTPDMQGLYRKMGWQDVEQRKVNDELVTIMKR